MVARGSFYFSFCRAIETWFAARLQVFDADRLSFSFILLLCLDFAFRQAQAARGAIRVSAVRFSLSNLISSIRFSIPKSVKALTPISRTPSTQTAVLKLSNQWRPPAASSFSPRFSARRLMAVT